MLGHQHRALNIILLRGITRSGDFWIDWKHHPKQLPLIFTSPLNPHLSIFTTKKKNQALSTQKISKQN